MAQDHLPPEIRLSWAAVALLALLTTMLLIITSDPVGSGLRR